MALLGPINIGQYGARGMGIEVDMSPSPLLLVAQFDKLGQDIRSFREPLKRSIQEVVAPSMQRNFDVMGRPRWQELAEATWQRKVQLGFSSVASRPLMRTGALRKVAGQLNIWNIDGLEGVATMSVPGKVWYGKVHQEGAGSGEMSLTRRRSRRTGRTIETEQGVGHQTPQRIWAAIQPEDEAAIEKVFADWLDERIRRSALMRSVV